MTPWSIIVGMLTVAIFLLSILAAILCAELYLLLSTGMLGSMWRTLTISLALFAIAEAVSFGEAIGLVGLHGLSQLLRAVFLTLLCIGFWQQRRAFMRALGIKHGNILPHILFGKLATRRRLTKVTGLGEEAKTQAEQTREAIGEGDG
ncbi:MAG: hypothetical protein RMK18_04625 [Armatimonadota bacterium]|nr:hypothetical protein [Armatimonadota bacterium]MCX7777088.1 hypothetical protein [Armatimonadota bacterium]MDW8025135.1 hypothetical protein [Armatimonadota bacterium]